MYNMYTTCKIASTYHKNLNNDLLKSNEKIDRNIDCIGI